MRTLRKSPVAHRQCSSKLLPDPGTQSGLTLVEILISVALFGITAGSLFGLLTFLNAQSIATRDLTTATELLRAQIEQALVLPYRIDRNLLDGVDSRVTPEILRLSVDGTSAVATNDPSTFNYDFSNEVARRNWTPSFRRFNFALSQTTTFQNVPLYVPADATRNNADLAGEKQSLRAPMVRGSLNMSTILLDSATGAVANQSLMIGGTLSNRTGLRIFRVSVNPNARGINGRGLPPQGMVTFRAPDN